MAAAEKPAKLDDIVLDPFKYFDTPMAVVDDKSLAKADRIRILQAMELEIREFEVATEENMREGPAPCNLEDVHKALRAVDPDEQSQKAWPTTKH